MTDTAFDTPPDGGAELEALLERSGVDFRREGDRFSYYNRFTVEGTAASRVFFRIVAKAVRM